MDIKIQLYLVLLYSYHDNSDEVMTDDRYNMKQVKKGAFLFCVSGVPEDNCPVTKPSQELICIAVKL